VVSRHTRAIVRVDERDGGTRALIVAGDWVRSDDGPAVRLFGGQLAAAIDAARTVADLSRRNAQLAVLNEVAALASEARDLETFFRRMIEAVRRVAAFSGCALFVPDEHSAELVRVHAEGGTADLDALTTRVPKASALGDVMRDRAARVVAVRSRAAIRRDGGDALRLAGPRSAGGALPRRRRPRRRVRGRPRRRAPGARPPLAVGAHCASAIESHGLLSDLRRRVGELTLLVDVARASSQLDPVLLLDASLRRIAETVGADVALAYLRDRDRLALVTSRRVHGDAAPIADLDAGEGHPGVALRRCTPSPAG
jgi:hypothetical protein